jgi:hypothetical protein
MDDWRSNVAGLLDNIAMRSLSAEATQMFKKRQILKRCGAMNMRDQLATNEIPENEKACWWLLGRNQQRGREKVI